jgi:hypothetical protein
VTVQGLQVSLETAAAAVHLLLGQVEQHMAWEMAKRAAAAAAAVTWLLVVAAVLGLGLPVLLQALHRGRHTNST